MLETSLALPSSTPLLGGRTRTGLGAWQSAGGSGARNVTSLVRRGIDVTVASVSLLVLAPVFFAIALVIRLESRGPALFVQRRVGLRGARFSLYKFRSMCVDAEQRRRAVVESAGAEEDVRFKWSADPRITPVGRILRRFSLDELPQLLNVLRGDMSLVGPRPPIPEEVERYTPRQLGRLAVRPGLTCTWQVGGRAEIPFEEQVEMDLDYIRRRSLCNDLKILLQTPRAVLLGRGAY